MNPRIVAIAGPLKGAEFRIPEAGLKVGRNAANDLCLDDETVTGFHGLIQLEKGQVWVHDNGSTNGMWVNGTAYLDRILRHGDRLKFGVSMFVYLEADDSTDALPDIIQDEVDQSRKLATLRLDRSVREDAAIYYKSVSQIFVEIARSLTAIVEPEKLHSRLLQLAFEIIPARRAAMMQNGRRISCDPGDFVSHVFRERDVERSAPFPLSGKVIREVYATGEPLMTNDVTPVICVPLKISGAMRGVLYMEGTNARSGHFENDHLQYLCGIAELAVTSLQLSSQFESVRTERDQLKE